MWPVNRSLGEFLVCCSNAGGHIIEIKHRTWNIGSWKRSALPQISVPNYVYYLAGGEIFEEVSTSGLAFLECIPRSGFAPTSCMWMVQYVWIACCISPPTEPLKMKGGKGNDILFPNCFTWCFFYIHIYIYVDIDMYNDMHMDLCLFFVYIYI